MNNRLQELEVGVRMSHELINDILQTLRSNTTLKTLKLKPTSHIESEFV